MADKDTRWVDKLVKNAGSVLARRLDSLWIVVERCTQSKVQAILVDLLMLNLLTYFV